MVNNKICVVVPSNLVYAPYYYRYEDILRKYYVKYDLILWNRENITECVSNNVNLIYFNLQDKTNDGNWKKIYKFFSFSKFVKHIIKDHHYEKLIFLGSYTGNAILLSYYLKKHYANNYWFDIRDYTYEWFFPFYLLEKKVIKNSYSTVISSDGFLDFLPDHHYVNAHNIDMRNILAAKEEPNIKSDIIRISFIGNVRYYEENIKVLELFKNDKRFLLQYFGKGSELLEKYCKENHIYNTKFVGYFKTVETKRFYAQTDIINNLYGNNNIGLKTALSNKLYFSAGLHKPILVSPNTYMAQLTSKYGMGFTFDYEKKGVVDELYNWFQLKQKNEPDYDELWNKVLNEDSKFVKKLEEYLKTDT